MACVALTSLMRTLELEFLQPNPRLILNDKQLIHSLCQKLGCLQTLLDESEKKAHNCEDLKDLIAKIGGVALEAEYDIEAELLEIRHQMLDVTLRRVLKDVEDLIGMIEARTAKVLQPQHPEESSSSAQHASKIEDTMVGHAKEFEEFKEKLVSSNKPLQVMSLVGMGGIGKTTFARKLADDSAVKRHFDCRGWATMSQEHNKRQVLLQLCRSIMPMRDDFNTMNDGELAEQLRKSLLGKRYLIIVDDIWTVEAWDDVKRCFPSEVENTGSQILLTTRHKSHKESVFLEATSLCIIHGNDPKYWRWTRDSGHEIAILRYVCWLEITGKLDVRRLHKITSYSAYLIFKLKEELF